ncbi:MAG: alcohol dehydrogenase [Gammaproteobacteria bacterium]|nr:alcohol dehydrogenase [Gammaproteobacteria bacterium]|tara:strand:- start:464 stop:1489 length:1026 start_codon:yes stop_codon:yes gene_type:complete
MKAALMQAGRIWVDEMDDPEPGVGEVLVKSRACGICGSDLHAVQHTEAFIRTSREVGGAFKLTTDNPVVLGHEFCVEVVDFGPDTERRLPTGSLICAIPGISRVTGFETVGYSDVVPGGFAEYMVLSESLCMPVPAGTPVEMAALTEPMAVAHHAVNKARLSGSEAILVAGAGPVGLAVLANLKQRGAGPVVVAELAGGRRQLAEQMGADSVVDPGEGSPYADAALTGAKGLVVFECVGVKGMIDQIFQLAPPQARVVVVGVCLEEDVSRPLIAINKELNLQFVLGYSVSEFSEALHMLADGTLDVGPLITDQIPLAEVPGAFSELDAPRHRGKVLVKPWD